VSYQGLGYYGNEPEPPKKNNTLLISLVVAAVVVVGLVGTLLIIGVRTETPGEALAVAGVATNPTSPKRTATNDPLQPKATGAPQVPGWRPIAINNGGQLQTSKAYDVPPTWQPMTSSATFGKQTKTTLYTPAIYMKGYCPASPTSFRSMAGLLTVDNQGTNEAQAAAAAQRLADAVYTTSEGTKPTVQMGQPQPVSVDRDKKGFTVTAKATLAPSAQDKCSAPSATITVMVLSSKPEDKTSVVLAAFADEGFAEATPEAHLQQIVTSIHAAN
jgi:hypothetical protein